jgi:heat-inducible transcriptional repressor
MPQLLNERAALLLKKLVYSYISDGQPVGSKKLANDAELNVSSATIRNMMSVLEKKGLVKAPHTSAGRIPTERGFRLFVDSMLEVQPIQKKLLLQLKKQLDPDQNTESLISSATQMVSELTRMAGIVTVPRPSEMKLRHIEFLSLPDRRVLAILVINEKEVQNRVLHMAREYSATELQRAANLLNQQFAGRDIFDVRQSIMNDLQRTRDDMDSIMQTAIEVADKALTQPSQPKEDYLVQGQANLVRYSDTTDASRLQQLLDVFGHKREMLELLDRCIQAEGVKIFIGNEVGVVGLGECSVVTAPYSINGRVVGVLGVIGPTRINYDRVIPVVDVTARLLGEALNMGA